MSIITWGLLQKSQIDDETIEEAITRLITEHNADESAHLGAGQSLQSHKASEIIDHLVESIVYDKLAEQSIDFKKLVGDQYMFITCFESFDGWNAIDGEPGYVLTTSIFGSLVSTDNDNDDWVEVATEPDAAEPVIKFDKNSFFQTTFRLFSNSSQLAYLVAGERTEGYGFKIVNNTLYAQHHNGSTETLTEITGITLINYNVYRAVFDAENAEIRFYVNGVLKATHSTNLPTGDTSYVFDYYLKTTTSEVRRMYMRDLIFSQVR